jgi:hypothetical protein
MYVIGAGTKTTAPHSHKPQAAGANPPQRVLSLNETANMVETKTKKKKKKKPRTEDIQQQQPSSAKTPKSFITYYQLTICNISASLSTSQPPPPSPLILMMPQRRRPRFLHRQHALRRSLPKHDSSGGLQRHGRVFIRTNISSILSIIQ